MTSKSDIERRLDRIDDGKEYPQLTLCELLSADEIEDISEISAPSLDQQALSLNTERTTNVGELQSQNEQTIRVVLDEQTDVVQGRIEGVSERVIEERERRTQRNSGRNLNPR